MANLKSKIPIPNAFTGGTKQFPTIRTKSSELHRSNNTTQKFRSIRPLNAEKLDLVRKDGADFKRHGGVHSAKDRLFTNKNTGFILSYDPYREAGSEYAIEKRTVGDSEGRNTDRDLSNQHTPLSIRRRSKSAIGIEKKPANTTNSFKNKQLQTRDEHKPKDRKEFLAPIAPSSPTKRSRSVGKLAVRSPWPPTTNVNTRETTLNNDVGGFGEGNKSVWAGSPDSSYILGSAYTIRKEPHLDENSLRSTEHRFNNTASRGASSRNGYKRESTRESGWENVDISPVLSKQVQSQNAIEGRTSSVPPPNFKTNLFSKPRRLVTGRRTPRFTPISGNRTSDRHTRVNANHRNAETLSVTSLKIKSLKKLNNEIPNQILISKETTFIKYSPNSRTQARERVAANNEELLNLQQDPNVNVYPIHGKHAFPKSRNVTTGLLTDNYYGRFNRKHRFLPDDSLSDHAYDVFTEDEKRRRLKQPQTIKDDLKIVKQKVEENKIIIIKRLRDEASWNTKQRNAGKRIAIKHKQKFSNENRQRRNVLLANRKVSETISYANSNAQMEEKKLFIKKRLHRATPRKVPAAKINIPAAMNGANDSKDDSSRIPDLRDVPISNKNTQNDSERYIDMNVLKTKPGDTAVWRPHAKIHQFDPNKTKRKPEGSTNIPSNIPAPAPKEANTETIVTQTPRIHKFNTKKDVLPGLFKNISDKNSLMSTDISSTSSITTWVMNSRSAMGRRLHRTHGMKPVPTIRHGKNKVNRLNKRPKFRDKLKETLTVNENMVNKGVYMPIKKRKRSVFRVYTKVGKVKGYESEIPILYSDDDDVYQEPRPQTDTDRIRYPNYRRYEQENDNYRLNYRDPAHRKIGRSSGALVRFFRNGDINHKGVPLTVNRNFKNLETLLVTLNDKIPTSTGVKYIFKWPEGTEIRSVTEFRNRCVYVVSSTKTLKRDVNYGDSKESYWSNKKPSAGKMRKDEIGLYQKPPSPKGSPARNSPLIVTIINNLSRDKREKVILNPQTQQTYEEWLRDIDCPDLPVKNLYTEKPPFTQVNSFSHLFRELRIQSNFIACGEEMLPLEITKKRQAPSSNSSNDSVSETQGRKKKLPRQQEMGQIYEGGRPTSPSSTAMSRYDMGPRYGGQRGRGLDSRRQLKDVFELEIDGVCRELYPPSYQEVEDDGARPDKQLKCDWVYGYRGRDARHNLAVLPKTGEVVYYVAAIVVLYDRQKDVQRHYTKHTEEITCMTMHPNEYLIATGQMHGKDPEHFSHIRIWHGVSLSTYSVIGLGVFYGGILSINFSMDGAGNYMCALDGSEKHVLSVWEWQTEKIVARTTTSVDPVHRACFYPDGHNNSILITYGTKHIYFWKIFYDVARKKEARILRDRNSGIFEEDIPKSINCVAFLSSGDVVTGDASGNLMLWDRDTADAFTCKVVVDAHQASITAMCLLDDGTLLTGAGPEIKAWDADANFRPIKARQIPVEAGNIRTIVPQTTGGNDGKLYIGTTHSAILDASLQNQFRYVVQGHSEGVWGIVTHPYEPNFISAGYDQVVYKWSLVTHKVIWRTQVEAPCTSVAVDHRNELVALGTSLGVFIILNAYNGMHIATIQVGTEPIGCLSFSRDGNLLAMGCNDGLISVFEVRDRGQTYCKFNMALRGHNTGVMHLDWSRDGRCIQSVGEDHELIFWEVDNMQKIKITWTMRDVIWNSNTCHVSYALIGPWSNLEKGEYIKEVSRNNYGDLIITGDSMGRLRLYKYPCTKERAESRNTWIYSSDVTAVTFTPDNRNVISCGGNDAGLVQWRVSDDQ